MSGGHPVRPGPAAAPEAAGHATITLTLNGHLGSARQGDTLLEVLRDHQIAVPTLCEFTGLTSPGACRLCLVDVAGRPRPMAACVTTAEEGMEVRTDTEQLLLYRRMTLELLLAERNHVCAVCVVNGHCELQSLAAASGVDHVGLTYQHPQNLVVDASHQRFAVDHNRCILCTRCVRICDEIEGAHTWDLAGRGTWTNVITDLATPWGDSVTCTSCGKCVQVCPTGALFEKGSTVAEMQKHQGRLQFLATARREHVWLVDLARASQRTEVRP